MLKNVLPGAVASFFAFFVQIFSAFFITRLMIKNLSPLDASSWFLLYSMAQFFYLCDFGLSSTISREVAFAQAKPHNSLKIPEDLAYVSFALYFILAIILFFTFSIAGELYLKISFHSSGIQNFSFIFFLMGTVFLFLNTPYWALHYGVGNVLVERFMRILLLSITVVSIYIFFMFNKNFEYLCLLWAIVNFIFYIILRTYTSFKFKLHYFKMIFSREKMLKILKVSGNQGVAVFGGWFIFQAGYFVIAYEIGLAYVSEYAPLMQISMGVMMVTNLLQYSSSPFISRMYAESNITNVRGLVLKFNQLALLFTITGAFFLCTNADLILHGWLGPNFHYSSLVLVILLIMTVLEVNHVSFAANAMACGYLKFARVAWLGGGLSFVFSSIFAHFLGLVGVAFGLFLAQLLSNNWYVVYLSLNFFKIGFSSYMNALKVVLGYIVSIAIIFVLLKAVPMSNGLRIIVSFLSYGVLFWVFIAFLYRERVSLLLRLCYMKVF